MNLRRTRPLLLIVPGVLAALLGACTTENKAPTAPGPEPERTSAQIIADTFGGAIDLAALADYTGQSVPRYVRENNSGTTPFTNAGATLGRVLFHDPLLSADRTVSCASCHRQELAFSDDRRVSTGVAGDTDRHSMRLLNVRFADEVRFFWNERAVSLEDQTTQPVRDHREMGFSGADGDPDFATLLTRLAATDYYQVLFPFVYGDSVITEARLQDALAQFIRSIQSFDAPYDTARAQVPDDRVPFPAFTALENQGKELFMRPPDLDDNGVRTGGGLACAGCHRPPEFDIDPAMQNNGIIARVDGIGTDQQVTRAPTLRNVVRADGTLNGGLMHTGDFDLDAVLDHYDVISAEGNTNLDPRLQPMGNPQRLRLTPDERTAVVAFLKTLAGTDLYTNPLWSDPFPPSPRP